MRSQPVLKNAPQNITAWAATSKAMVTDSTMAKERRHTSRSHARVRTNAATPTHTSVPRPAATKRKIGSSWTRLVLES